MQISFSPTVNSYRNTSFMARSKKDDTKFDPSYTPTRDEVLTAKTKKAISECTVVTIGVAMLYFAMKRNFKMGRIKKEINKQAELAKQEVLYPLLMKKKVAE